jgi:peptidoglycan/LPS O-acetylase OafA/YrhL
MRLTQAPTLILGLASIGFVIAATALQAMDLRSIALVGAGGIVLLLALMLPRRRGSRQKLLSLALNVCFSGLVLSAFVSQLDQERMLGIRAGLSALLLGGLMLTLWSGYGGGANTRRRDLGNYYD